VGGDVRVAYGEEIPTFFDGCDLSIEESSIVYVADHNNEAFYKGCTYHYSDQ
jgi:hypothetical protein